MSGFEKIRKQRLEIINIAARHGASHLRVFGSVVRNEDRPDSDLDFLVTMDPGRDLLDLVALEQELQELLQQKTDVVSDEEVNPYLRSRISREAVAV